MDDGEAVFASDDEKRAAFLAWMSRVDLGEVLLGVMREREEAERNRVRRWVAMRERWKDEADR